MTCVLCPPSALPGGKVETAALLCPPFRKEYQEAYGISKALVYFIGVPQSHY